MFGKVLAVITARGGSKRIPRKNMKEFCGKPILAYSMDAAKEAKCFDEIMVSTDDDEIARYAAGSGVSVPFLRSSETADDFATTIDVLQEVIHNYEQIGREFEYLVCLYPTAPFVTAERLRDAVARLQKGDVDAVVPIVPYSFPPQRSFILEDNFVKYQWPEHMLTRSQDLPAVYHDAGQFYCINIERFKIEKKLIMARTAPLILNELEVQDIDTVEDWLLAEMKYKIRSEQAASGKESQRR
ncbi:MAG: pseudaminic acid cytidylyltransferase [Lachnospiraceae bacterium]|nr:pseudaminic acid cytidylyltransferase [Lachnospiraceae bacterium]